MDKRVVDITGQKFGILTALYQVKKQGEFRAMWKCKCDCGNEIITAGSSLRRGSSKSCGCTTSQFKSIQIKKMKLQDYNENLRMRLEEKTKWKDGCLEWQPEYKTNSTSLDKEGKNQTGYGLIRYKNAMMLAHRASWIVHKGEIPKGMCVLHMCDNPISCNPKHLYLGSNQDNANDKSARGRSTATKYPQEIKDKALDLRRKGMKCKFIEKELGIPKRPLSIIFNEFRDKGVDV